MTLQHFEYVTGTQAKVDPFEVEVKFMFGDASSYKTERYKFITEEMLVRFVDLLQKILFIRGWHNWDQFYEKVGTLDGYMEFFTSLKYELEEGEEDPITLELLRKGYGENYWPKDPIYQYPAQLSDFHVYHHTPAGRSLIRRKEG